ncbi:Hypothetical protein CINCED_3A011694 [Cinara cedri]|uniref:Uncharacterized protein n=1 Tax=Cinara cedri TaxID=506608 RepID=A0A5E4MCT1_9HEMI|nr:Hypothetical protein CINCED_3A011694 [Cinara cedri]
MIARIAGVPKAPMTPSLFGDRTSERSTKSGPRYAFYPVQNHTRLGAIRSAQFWRDEESDERPSERIFAACTTIRPYGDDVLRTVDLRLQIRTNDAKRFDKDTNLEMVKRPSSAVVSDEINFTKY